MQTDRHEQSSVELDHRESDGIVVSLLWDVAENVVTVAASDERTGEAFEVVVPPDRALDAFRHPYAYDAWLRRADDDGAELLAA
jgi:hypothetical protein